MDAAQKRRDFAEVMVPEVRGHEGAQGDRQQHAGERDATPQRQGFAEVDVQGPGFAGRFGTGNRHGCHQDQAEEKSDERGL